MTEPGLRATLLVVTLLGAHVSAHAAKPTGATLPELLRSDGLFCARQTPRNPHLCEFVLRIKPLESENLWVSYTTYVRAKDGLPDVKLRVGHPATILNGEVCITPSMSTVTIEIFEAKDIKPVVRSDEVHLKEKSEELVAKLELDDPRATFCRGLTHSGHLLTFDSSPTVLHFVSGGDVDRLRLRPEKHGL